MSSESTVRIVVLLPELLGTYGDRGNALVLAHRLLARGHGVDIIDIHADQTVPTCADLYLLGGGEDTAGTEAIRVLADSAFPAAVHRGAMVFAVCAGLQILGTLTPAPGGRTTGLDLLDVTTTPGPTRAVGETLARLTPPVTDTLPAGRGAPTDTLLTGFENHRGRTVLGPDAQPLAHTITGVGNGDGSEGATHDTIIGTYLHGPVLARNPLLADHLLTQITGLPLTPLHIDEITTLRRESIDRAHHQHRHTHRLRRHLNALIPHRWTNPGIPPHPT